MPDVTFESALQSVVDTIASMNEQGLDHDGICVTLEQYEVLNRPASLYGKLIYTDLEEPPACVSQPSD